MCASTPSNTRRLPLVGVEAVVEKRPQQAAALGDAERERAVERCFADAELRCALVLEPRDGVADRGQSQSGKRRVRGRIDDLVDALRLETARQVDARRIRYDVAAAVDARELPVVARNRAPLAERRVAHGQRMSVALRVGDGVGDMVAVAERMIADTGRADDEVAAHEPRDSGGGRRVDAQKRGSAGGGSSCQPTQNNEKPCSSRKPSPSSRGSLGSRLAAAWFSIGRMPLPPRFETSNSSAPLPRATSFGFSKKKSARNSTRPAALVGASSRSVTVRLAELWDRRRSAACRAASRTARPSRRPCRPRRRRARPLRSGRPRPQPTRPKRRRRSAKGQRACYEPR